MNVLYFLASVFLRGFSLLNIIMLGWLLGPREYGTYVVLISAAAFINSIFASWLQASVSMFWRRSLSGQLFSEWQATFLIGFGFVVAANIFAFSVVTTLITAHLSIPELMIVFGLTTGMALCELTAAYLNGNGQAANFLRFNMTRSILMVAVGIGAVIAGYGAIGAALAILLGQIVALALPEARLLWQGLQVQYFKAQHLRQALKTGIPSSLVFGFYPLLQALYRNGISINWDNSRAGLVSFCIDVLIAPLALVGATFTYTVIPKMSFGQARQHESENENMREFLALIAMTCLIYALGMLVLGKDFIRTYFPVDFRESSVVLIWPALLFGVSLTISNTIAFVLVARGMTTVSTIFVVLSLIYCAGAMFTLDSRDHVEETWFLAQAMAHCTVVALAYAFWLGLFKLDFKELAKVIAAIAVFYVSLESIQRANLWSEPVSKGLVSMIPFSIVAVGLRSKLIYRIFLLR
jgi:O-antigen/teichoic acid export membrane protein